MKLTEPIYITAKGHGIIKPECEIINDRRKPCYNDCQCDEYWCKGNLTYTKIELIN